MASIKVDTYQYESEEELLDNLEDLGYTFDGKLSQGVLFTPDGNALDYVYFSTIILNYPDTGIGWTPEYSEDVYINSARIGSTKLPSNKKVNGNARKYFNNYINRFAGEAVS